MAEVDFERAWNEHYSCIAYYVRHAFPTLRSEADDLAQETFARACAGRASLSAAAPVAPWLYAIARNLCVDRLRRAGRRRGGEGSLDEAAAEAPAGGSDPGYDLERRELRSSVAEAVDALPPEDREICLFYYFEGWSVAEIGRLTGRPAGTVKYRLFRIRALLRKRMEGCFG